MNTLTGQMDSRITGYIKASNLDTVKGAFEWEGGEDLVKPGLDNRRRTRISFRTPDGEKIHLFMKRYYPVSLLKRLKSFFFARARMAEAVVECKNIQAMLAAGVPTMRVVAVGSENGLLGPVRSYIVVTLVPGDAIERCGKDFLDRHADMPEIISEFTSGLVTLASNMHMAGLVHRDFYSSHIFLHSREGGLSFYLIDLARAFRPAFRMFRWRVKDLAQLKFSMPEKWVSKCWDDFIAGYLEVFDDPGITRWNSAIDARVSRMRRRMKRKESK